MTEAHGENFGPKIDRVEASVYTIPTDAPESDGTFEWTETTVVVVEARSGSECGIGYSYTHSAAVQIIRETLADAVCGLSVMAVSAAWIAMLQKVRNIGRNGVAASAISAVGTALWDLKARTLGVSLVDLFGAVREKIPVYGSGGFTSYSLERLRSQLGGWVEAGIPCVKMKIGTRPEEDVERVRAARDAIGRDAELFVDANGAYSRKQALTFAEAFATFNVSWFEEPVSSDDLEGLKLLRDHAPASMAIAAGEYGYTPSIFGGCSMLAPSMCFRPMPRVAVDSAGFSRPAFSVTRDQCSYPRIRRPRCTVTSAVPSRPSFTSSTSTTTSESSPSFSMASPD